MEAALTVKKLSLLILRRLYSLWLLHGAGLSSMTISSPVSLLT